MNLLIVESPSKAKTLKKYLGSDFQILASYGHVRDLVPKSGAVDPDQSFKMDYQLIERNEKHVQAIIKAVKEADHVYLATDPDREGEAIAWHLAEIIQSKRGLKNKLLERVTFYEITQDAVRSAVANPRAISMPLVNAQQARRALDYLVGFNLSPLLWKKIRRGLSAGRVQSPALRLIVEREQEIQKFISQEYWSVHFKSQKQNISFSARLTHFSGQKLSQLSIESASAFHTIEQALKDFPAQVLKIDKKVRQRQPSAPFTTSTLQQEAVRKLGFTTDRTMKVAQQLYEGINLGHDTTGLITYMRTDAVILSSEALNQIRTYISEQFSEEYLPKKPIQYANHSKNAQEAHEAIRPTAIQRTPDQIKSHLTPDQFALYSMIWKRTLASQMNPARFDTVAVDFTVGHPGHIFRANGQTLTFPGFIAVYRESLDETTQQIDSDDEAQLPAFNEGETLPIEKLWGEQHATQPPPRFTEASLVKSLEEFGIGRPSTYASIISTLVNREYVTLDKKRFAPTDVGTVVSLFLTEHFTQYVDYDFTARLEDQLDQISEGKQEWLPVLSQFWDQFHETLQNKSQVSRAEVTQEKLDENCPKCGQPLSIRLGRRGKFIGCQAYPTCDFTRNLNGETPITTEPVELGMEPTAHIPLYLLTGPYGPYIQLGLTSGDTKKKPKRVSLVPPLTPEQLTLELAIQHINLPREVGIHPETQKKITVNNGRFGPYIQHDGAFRSIPKTESLFTIDLERCLFLLNQPKTNQRSKASPIRSLGTHPQDNELVNIFLGPYGHYVKHGKVNATIPKSMNLDNLTMDEAITLLTAKNEAQGVTRKRTSKKKTQKK
jgi:DNA topoisomerase-1